MRCTFELLVASSFAIRSALQGRILLKQPDISVVVPVYQGSRMLEFLVERLEPILKRIGSFEIILVDDGSSDDSYSVILKLARRNRRVKGIRLSRNFGQHNATLAGLASGHGRILVTMDQDLQNPPEELPRLLSTLEKGYDVVYGIAAKRAHGAFRNVSSDFSKWIAKKILSTALRGNFSSFRAMHQWVVQEIVRNESEYVFIDGLISWATTNVGGVEVRNDRSEHGSQYSFWKLVNHGLNLLVNFSIKPLKTASIVGTVSAGLGLVAAVFVILDKLMYGVPVQGWASLMVAVLVMAGVQLVFLGLIGEYVGRILMNVNKSPKYIVREQTEISYRKPASR